MLNNILKVCGIIVMMILFVILAPFFLVILWFLVWGGIAFVILGFIIWMIMQWINER